MPRKRSSRDRRKIAISDLALLLAAVVAAIGVASVLGWQGATATFYLAFLVMSVLAFLDLLTWLREPGYPPTLLMLWAPIALGLAVWLAISGQLLLLLALFCLAPWLAVGSLVSTRAYRAVLMWRARDGNAAAQFQLAEIFYYGDGLPEDIKTAVHWYHLSAQQRNVKAARMLSRLYQRGEGVPKNQRLADEWRQVSHRND